MMLSLDSEWLSGWTKQLHSKSCSPAHWQKPNRNLLSERSVSIVLSFYLQCCFNCLLICNLSTSVTENSLEWTFSISELFTWKCPLSYNQPISALICSFLLGQYSIAVGYSASYFQHIPTNLLICLHKFDRMMKRLWYSYFHIGPISNSRSISWYWLRLGLISVMKLDIWPDMKKVV